MSGAQQAKLSGVGGEREVVSQPPASNRTPQHWPRQNKCLNFPICQEERVNTVECCWKVKQDEDWKMSTDSMTGTSLVNLIRAIFVKWKEIHKCSCVIHQFKDHRTMKGRSILVSAPQPNDCVTLQKSTKCPESWFSHLKWEKTPIYHSATVKLSEIIPVKVL